MLLTAAGVVHAHADEPGVLDFKADVVCLDVVDSLGVLICKHGEANIGGAACAKMLGYKMCRNTFVEDVIQDDDRPAGSRGFWRKIGHDAWLACMRLALEECVASPGLRAEADAQIARFAEHMRNRA